MIESGKPKPASKAVNPRAQQIAAVYAKAVLGAAEQAGQADAVVQEFAAFIEDALDKFPDLELVFASALISHEEKSAILDRVFASKLSPLFLNFLKVLSRHGRLDIVRAVYQQVHKLHDEARGNIRVQMATATPLANGITDQLIGSLRKMLGGEPKVEQAVDPAIIGGLVLRVGDTVYDGSVARQLDQLREQMITRSVHEIQSRRDRFRPTGGN